MEQLIYTFDITGFILAIVSVVLAVVSIVFSAIFFWWGKKQNDSASQLTVIIEEKVTCLEKLFDKMYDSTYQIVRENNQAMQRQLFQDGSFESQNLENKDMDVTLLILSKKTIKKEEICSSLNIPKDMVDNIVKKLAEKGKVSIEPDNETVMAIDIETAKIDSSANGVGDVSTTSA
ncbi:MAG: hypothetical protein IJK78_00525 [Bacteroidales bacterium]|nr:hypothetical protein [Bacteroidales bacterium]